MKHSAFHSGSRRRHWTLSAAISSVTILSTVISLAAVLCGCGDSENATSAKSALRTLATSWESTSDSEAKSLLDRMTMEDHFVLEYVGGSPLKEAVFRRACSVNPSILWSYDATGVTQDCATSIAEWQECLAWFGSASCQQNIELGLGDVQIYYRCQSGELDAQTCATYRGISAQIDADVAATTDTIIRNTGDQCRVGVDPNCYP